MKEKDQHPWIIMKRLKNKTFLGLIILLLLASCKQESFLTESDINDINILLNCKNVIEKKRENYYFIETNDSELKTDFGKKMGVSLVSLILYERVYNAKNTLDYNSTFGVKFYGDSNEYNYNLQEISSANAGRKLIEIVIEDLVIDSLESYYFYGEISNLTSLNWSDVEEIGAIGFEQAQVNYYNEEIKSVLFRYNVSPMDKEIWFYYSEEKNKIISIVDPRNLIDTR